MEKLLNEENIWDEINDSTTVSVPRPNIMEVEVMVALKGMKQGKAAYRSD
jgi:hypothetical protein